MSTTYSDTTPSEQLDAAIAVGYWIAGVVVAGRLTQSLLAMFVDGDMERSDEPIRMMKVVLGPFELPPHVAPSLADA